MTVQGANPAVTGEHAAAHSHGTYKSTNLPDIKVMMWVFLASEFDYAAEFDFSLDLILDGLERLRG